MKSNYENIFCEELALAIEADLKIPRMPSLLRELEVRSHQKILYDITALYGGGGEFRPKLGFMEQDIVIGKSLTVREELGACFFRTKVKSVLFQPEIVMEIKYGNVTTHPLITYSQIAARIKSVFPRCRYYLVLGYCSVKSFEIVMRHGTNFDRIVSLCARRKGQATYPPYTRGKLARDMAGGTDNRALYDDMVSQLRSDLLSIKITW